MPAPRSQASAAAAARRVRGRRRCDLAQRLARETPARRGRAPAPRAAAADALRRRGARARPAAAGAATLRRGRGAVARRWPRAARTIWARCRGCAHPAPAAPLADAEAAGRRRPRPLRARAAAGRSRPRGWPMQRESLPRGRAAVPPRRWPCPAPRPTAGRARAGRSWRNTASPRRRAIARPARRGRARQAALAGGARARRRGGRRSRARLGLWEEVLDLDHGTCAPRLALGRLLEDAARRSRPSDSYRDLAELRPDAIEPLYQLGRLAIAQSDLAAAVGWLERAPALDPRTGGAAALTRAPWPSSTASPRPAAWPRTCWRGLPDFLDAHLLLAWVEERAGRARRAVRADCADAAPVFPQAFAPPLRQAELLTRARPDAAKARGAGGGSAVNPDTLSLRLALADCLLRRPERQRPPTRWSRRSAPTTRRTARSRSGVARLEVQRRRLAPPAASGARSAASTAGWPARRSTSSGSTTGRSRRPPARSACSRGSATSLCGCPGCSTSTAARASTASSSSTTARTTARASYLLRQPDMHLFLTTDAYAVHGGGMRWLNDLLERHGTGTWCLTVDVDEVLAYPHAERLGLRGAHRRTSTARAPRRLFGFMLDMYAEDSLHEWPTARATIRSSPAPASTAPATSERDHPDFPFRMVAGGLVSRFLYDRKQDGVYLHKVPLVRWQAGCATPAAPTRSSRSRWPRRAACCSTSSTWPTSSTAPGSRPSASSTGRAPSATRCSTAGWHPRRDRLPLRPHRALRVDRPAGRSSA